MEEKRERWTTLIRLLLILSGIGALFEANTHNITPPKYLQLEASRLAVQIQISEAVGCRFLFAGIVLLLVHTFYPEKKLWPTVGYGLLALHFEGSLVFLAVFLVVAAYRQRAYPVPVMVIGGLWALYELISLGDTIYTDIRWTHLFRHWQDWVICAAHLCLLAGVILLQWHQRTTSKSK